MEDSIEETDYTDDPIEFENADTALSSKLFCNGLEDVPVLDELECVDEEGDEKVRESPRSHKRDSTLKERRDRDSRNGHGKSHTSQRYSPYSTSSRRRSYTKSSSSKSNGDKRRDRNQSKIEDNPNLDDLEEVDCCDDDLDSTTNASSENEMLSKSGTSSEAESDESGDDGDDGELLNSEQCDWGWEDMPELCSDVDVVAVRAAATLSEEAMDRLLGGGSPKRVDVLKAEAEEEEDAQDSDSSNDEAEKDDADVVAKERDDRKGEHSTKDVGGHHSLNGRQHTDSRHGLRRRREEDPRKASVHNTRNESPSSSRRRRSRSPKRSDHSSSRRELDHSQRPGTSGQVSTNLPSLLDIEVKRPLKQPLLPSPLLPKRRTHRMAPSIAELNSFVTHLDMELFGSSTGLARIDLDQTATTSNIIKVDHLSLKRNVTEKRSEGLVRAGSEKTLELETQQKKEDRFSHPATIHKEQWPHKRTSKHMTTSRKFRGNIDLSFSGWNRLERKNTKTNHSNSSSKRG